MKFRNLAALVMALGLAGCGFPVRNEKLTGGFILFAADDPADLSICYEYHGSCIGCVPGTISRVGWNKRYIVAERHPDNDGNRAEYYYIDLRVPDAAMSGVTGPFSLTEFNAAASSLGLPPLSRQIDKTYSLERPK